MKGCTLLGGLLSSFCPVVLTLVESSSSALNEVPTGVPVTGAGYEGALRPQIHYSPPSGFMNDPNGLFRDSRGTWHLYYQYNPTDVVAGNQHWGHATSNDLYHWTNQPIALFPSGAEGEGIFSGSTVVDFNNTSGFFPNQTNGVVAIYTLHTEDEETQDIAYSHDGGFSFTKYESNPVISIGSRQFRDPKVIWHEPTSRWVMVVAYAQEYTIGFFTSYNLINWTHVSNFTDRGFLGLQYECPNLVQLPMLKNASAASPLDPSNYADIESWVLFLSINPGAPLGGSVSQYFPGAFNGTHFEPYDGATRLTDFAKDAYAGQWFFGLSNVPQVSIAWASNWQYTQLLPTDREGFRSVMQIPRTGVLANTTRNPYALLSAPYDLSPLYTTDQPIAKSENLANNSLLVNFGKTVPSRAISFVMNATGIPVEITSGQMNFTIFSSSTGETIRGGFFLSGDSVFWLDRGNTRGFDNEFFTDKFSTAHLIDRETGKLSMHVVVDRSIIEVFLDGGVKSGTSIFFTDGPLDLLVLSVSDLPGSSVVSAEVWGLEGTWGGQGGNSSQVMERV